jgi:hypothetical protein
MQAEEVTMCLQTTVVQGSKDKDIYEKLREGMHVEGNPGNFSIIVCRKKQNPNAKEEEKQD